MGSKDAIDEGVSKGALFVHPKCLGDVMSAVLTPSLAETFREPDAPYLSPRRLGDALGLQVQSLAQRAHVHRNTPRARPQSEALQGYMREVVRVLAAAEEAASGDRERAIFWYMNEPLSEFDFRTPDELVSQGKAQVVMDYIESILGGATG